MQKIILIFVASVFLAGCQTAAERAAARAASDNRKCSSYGFTQGTTAYSNCLMQQDGLRKQQKIIQEENNRAIKCAELRAEPAYGVKGGMLKGLALGLNGC